MLSIHNCFWSCVSNTVERSRFDTIGTAGPEKLPMSHLTVDHSESGMTIKKLHVHSRFWRSTQGHQAILKPIRTVAAKILVMHVNSNKLVYYRQQKHLWSQNLPGICPLCHPYPPHMDRTMFLMSVLCCHFQSWVLLRGGQRVHGRCDWFMIRCGVRVERWRTCGTWTLPVHDFVQCISWIKWCGAERRAYKRRVSQHMLSKKGSSLTSSYPTLRSPLVWSCSHVSLASVISLWRRRWDLGWTASR